MKIRPLQILVDLKTAEPETMTLLAFQIKPFVKLFKKSKVTFVISGNMPLPASFDKYSKIFSFDGRKDIKYTQKQSKRVELLSCSRFDFLRNPSKMKLLVDSVHAQNKKIRFWGFGNTFKDFEYQTQLGVDFVGTDSLQLLKKYIEQ